MKPEHFAAILRQRPDSIAPDGAPLMFIPVSSGAPLRARKATGRDDSHGDTTGRSLAPRGQSGKDSFDYETQLNSFNHGSVVR